MTYDRWAKQKEQVKKDFDEYMTNEYGAEQSGVSPALSEKLLDAWNWSAIRAFERAANLAERTYEGGTANSDDGDSGYDVRGENTAQALREIVDGLAVATGEKT